MDGGGFLKLFHSALIIMPPTELVDQIQEIRKDKDTAYQRWMPHVNMSFPFVQPEKFKEAAALLQKEFDDFEAFEITLDKFNHFSHRGAVVWLNPACNDNQIQQIQTKIQKVFPFLNDLSKKGEHGFQPHLTCGQFQLSTVEKTKTKYQEKYKPITFLCDQLCLISREGKEAPFEVREVVRLKKKEVKSTEDELSEFAKLKIE